MQLPNQSTPVARCETLAAFAQEALRRYIRVFNAPADVGARLESLAGTLGGATSALTTSQAAYRTAVVALIPARVELKLVDLKAAEIVRSVKRAADDAGGNVSSAVFAGGVTPIVKPFGASQATALRSLEGLITAQSSWAARDAQLARVSGVRTEYETALTARAAGMTAASAARAVRDAAKEDFLDAYAAVAGAIKELFPRDRPTQDVFFDNVRSRETGVDDDTDTEPPPPA